MSEEKSGYTLLHYLHVPTHIDLGGRQSEGKQESPISRLLPCHWVPRRSLVTG